MIIYSVTVNILAQIESDWVEWMRAHHIPDVMRTGQFVEWEMRKLLIPEPEEGVTYNIQYTCKSMEAYDHYVKLFAPALQQEHTERYQHQFVAFRTILEKL